MLVGPDRATGEESEHPEDSEAAMDVELRDGDLTQQLQDPTRISKGIVNVYRMLWLVLPSP